MWPLLLMLPVSLMLPLPLIYPPPLPRVDGLNLDSGLSTPKYGSRVRMHTSGDRVGFEAVELSPCFQAPPIVAGST